MKFGRRFAVRVPAEIAFAYFSDPGRAFDRLAPQYHVTLTWSGPIERGATFELRAPNPHDNCTGVVEEFQRPRHLSYRLWVTDDPERGGVVTMDFEGKTDTTEVEATIETRMSPGYEVAASLLRPLLVLLARRGIKKQVRILEEDYRGTVGE